MFYLQKRPLMWCLLNWNKKHCCYYDIKDYYQLSRFDSCCQWQQANKMTYLTSLPCKQDVGYPVATELIARGNKWSSMDTTNNMDLKQRMLLNDNYMLVETDKQAQCWLYKVKWLTSACEPNEPNTLPALYVKLYIYAKIHWKSLYKWHTPISMITKQYRLVEKWGFWWCQCLFALEIETSMSMYICATPSTTSMLTIQLV